MTTRERAPTLAPTLPQSEVADWLEGKLRAGRLLALPTYYPSGDSFGQRPERFARKLLAAQLDPDHLGHSRAWVDTETVAFRRWVESNPKHRPIHPGRGASEETSTVPVAPGGVSWSPPSASHDPASTVPKGGGFRRRPGESRPKITPAALLAMILIFCVWIGSAVWLTSSGEMASRKVWLAWASGVFFLFAAAHHLGAFDVASGSIPRGDASPANPGLRDDWLDPPSDVAKGRS